MRYTLDDIRYCWTDIVKDERKLQHYFINAIYAIRRAIKQHFERKNKC